MRCFDKKYDTKHLVVNDLCDIFHMQSTRTYAWYNIYGIINDGTHSINK